MIEANLEELAVSAKARIEAATSVEELEAVRVEVLGRKGALANEIGRASCRERV